MAVNAKIEHHCIVQPDLIGVNRFVIRKYWIYECYVHMLSREGEVLKKRYSSTPLYPVVEEKLILPCDRVSKSNQRIWVW